MVGLVRGQGGFLAPPPAGGRVRNGDEAQPNCPG